MKNHDRTFTLMELSTLVGMNMRKIRYYIQKGLVDRPQGVGKGAFYTHQHLEQLLSIRKWKNVGLSLERIQEILGDNVQTEKAGKTIPPPRTRKPGSVEVWSHLHIADGVALHIEPERSGLNPEQVRELCREIVKAYENLK